MSLDEQLIVEQLDDAAIEAALARLERTYGMSSEEFLRQFDAGLLGDTPDFIDWSGLLILAAGVGLRPRARA